MWDWSENQITLVMIRHGVTLSNKEHRYLGKNEEGLSEEGRWVLFEKKSENKYPELSFVFTSPMKRCVETAEILYPEATKRLIAEWEEMDFGDFEGKNYQDLKDDLRYQQWIDSNGTLPFPGGESREVFIERCKKGFEKMLDHLFNAEDPVPNEIGAIVHGGTIMAVLSTLCEGDYFDYQVANGEGYRLVFRCLNGNFEKIELERL